MSIEVIYSPNSQLRRPRQFLVQSLIDLWASRELARRLLIRSLNAQYRQSVLGYLWLLLPPLATALIWVILRASRIISFPDLDIPYPVYIITGIFLWQGFLKLLNTPSQQLAASKHILNKIKFPWEALILAGIGEALFEFALYLVVLASVFVWFEVEFTLMLFLGLLGLLPLLLFGLALGLLLLPWNLLYSDIQRGINITTMILFFVTPIIYPLPSGDTGRLLVVLNPIAALLVSARELLTGTGLSYPGLYLLVGGLVLPLTLAGWIIFRLSVPHLIARI